MIQTIRDFFWVVFLPVSWVYSWSVLLSFRLKKTKSPKVPTISIGNIHSGGTGKTPLVIQIAAHYSDRKPAILSRGYRSKLSSQGARVDLGESNGPALFGDEPWMMANKGVATVYIGANRKKVLETYKIETNHQLLILDDGFQHRQLNREVDLVVIPGDESPLSSNCLPAGNLREPLRALKRATVVVITCANRNSPQLLKWKSLIAQTAPEVPVFLAERKSHWPADSRTWGAFCGIANPSRFKKDLDKTCKLQFFKSFRDHNNYSRRELEGLIKAATQASVNALLTTEKDFPKVESFFRERGVPLFAVPVSYELPDDFWAFLEKRIEKAC
jgi:tetraacyldisaccharide 4'-kinase